MIEHTTSINHNIYSEPNYDLKGYFQTVLFDATKLFCDATQGVGGKGLRTWSPELPEYLFNHPEKCDETLKIISDADYEETYYYKI